MDRDIAPLSRNVLASFLANRAGVPVENLRRIPLNARSKLANFLPPSTIDIVFAPSR